jgi:hypothetical protein
MGIMRTPAGAQERAHDLRCQCGRLMARRTSAGIELKCQRCKRVVVVPAPPVDGRWVVVPSG